MRPLFATIAATLALWAGTGDRAAAQDVLKLATQNLPPYHMLVDGELVGIAVDRMHCALSAMARPYELHVIEWKDAQNGTRLGEFAGFFAGSANSDRAGYATASYPVISEDLAWYMPKGAGIDPNSEEDKVRARFSAKFATSKWLNLQRGGYNVVRKPRDAGSLLTMLDRGDIDVALEYELIFEYFMEQSGVSPEKFDKIPFRRQDLSVHFSNDFIRANPLFLSRFNRELERCVAANPSG